MKTSLQTLLLSVAVLAATISLGQGVIDNSFNINGRVSLTTAGSNYESFLGVGVQSTGKIIALGERNFNSTNAQLLVARYNVNGTIDSTFGTNGFVTLLMGGSTTFSDGAGLHILPDDRILVAGTARAGSPVIRGFYVGRLTANGALDLTFNGGTGWNTVYIPTYQMVLRNMKVTANGKIILGGTRPVASSPIPVIARFNTSGSIDSTFATNGVFNGVGLNMECAALDVLPDGTVFAAGPGNPNTTYRVIKLYASGERDSRYGGTGFATYQLSGFQSFIRNIFSGIQALPDKSVVVGTTKRAFNNSANDDFFLIKFDRSGNLAANFGTNGVSSLDLRGNQDQCYNLLALANGGFIAVGFSSFTNDLATADFAVAFINANGAYNNTLGSLPGRTIFDFTGGHDDVFGVSLQSDGKVLLSGLARVSGKRVAALARLTSPAAPNQFTALSAYNPEIKSRFLIVNQPTTATVQVVSNAFGAASQVKVEFSTNDNFSSNVNSTAQVAQAANFNDTTINFTLSGLQAGTSYYARAIITNTNGSDTSQVLTFFYNSFIPADSLALWLRADLGVGAVSNNVNKWTDFSPKSNDLTQVVVPNRPQFVNNVINGLPVLRFFSNNKFMNSSKPIDLTNGPTLFIVGKNTQRKNGNGLLKIAPTTVSATGEMDWYWTQGTAGNGNLNYLANKNATITGLAKGNIYNNLGNIDQFYIISSAVNSNVLESSFFLGDSLTISTTLSTGAFKPQAISNLFLGVGNITPTIPGYFEGDIAEVICYNRPLSTAERQQVEVYLALKYAINLPNLQPEVRIAKAANVTSTSAQLRGSIRTASLPASYIFQYDTLSNFSTAQTTAAVSLPANNSFVNVAATVSLQPGRLYYYRLQVSSALLNINSGVKAVTLPDSGIIPLSNAVLWLRADKNVERTTGNKVASIADVITGQVLFSENTASAPLWRDTTLNGRPVLRFDSTQYLKGVTDIAFPSQSITTFIVAKNRVRKNFNGLIMKKSTIASVEGSNFEYYWSAGSSNSGNAAYWSNRNFTGFGGFSSGGSNAGPPVNNPYLWFDQARNLGSPFTNRKINNVIALNSSGGSTRVDSVAGGNLYLGAGRGGNNFFNSLLDGDIAEVIIYDQWLAPDQVDSVQVYLDQKYNLGLFTATPSVSFDNANAPTFEKISNTSMRVRVSVNNPQLLSGVLTIKYSTDSTFSTYDSVSSFRPIPVFNTSTYTTDLVNLTMSNSLVYVTAEFTTLAGIKGTSPMLAFMSPTISLFDDLNLGLWYRADANVLIDANQNISNFYNLRGGQNYFSQFNSTSPTNRPELSSSQINGHPAINFGLGKVLSSVGDMQLTGALTYVTVFRSTSIGSGFWLYGTIYSGYSRLTDSDPTIQVGPPAAASPSVKNAGPTWAVDNTWRIAVHRYNGSDASHQLLINGQTLALTSGQVGNPSGIGTTLMNLGSSGSSTSLYGQIAEVLFFSEYLDGTNLTSVVNYLNGRYGIVTGLANIPNLGESDVSVYPNPFEDYFSVEIRLNNSREVKTRLLDMTGRIQSEYTRHTITPDHNRIEISTADLHPGIYVLEIMAEGKVIRKKVIKE